MVENKQIVIIKQYRSELLVLEEYLTNVLVEIVVVLLSAVDIFVVLEIVKGNKKIDNMTMYNQRTMTLV